MIDAVLWLLAVEAFGLAALPLSWWLLRSLPRGGMGFAKPLGLLVVGYVVWLGSSVGVLANAGATAATALLVLGVTSWALLGRQVLPRLHMEWRSLACAEAVFLLFFVATLLLRAYNPAISGTEKPMDFAFFNASFRDRAIPPEDPWLAGYGISYYYFGYFLLAMVAKVAGVAPSVAFNLSLATLSGLVAAGSYSLLFNLVSARATREGASLRAAALYALLGPLFILLLSNLEGVFEVLHNDGLFASSFWSWLGIRDLADAPIGPHWYPSDPPDTWWWWRASRVVGDFDLATGASRDYTINEFPFFSFLLGDLHPHVMALPFVTLALALALAAIREPEVISLAWLRNNRLRAALYVLCFGALGFLNSWDLPTFLLILVLAVAVQRALGGKLLPGDALRYGVAFGFVSLVLALAAYLPFYLGLRTQASGVGLVEVRSKLHHFLIFWGPLLCTVVAYPLVLLSGKGRAMLSGRLQLPLAGVALASFLALVAVGATTLAVLLVVLSATIAALWRALFVAPEDGRSPLLANDGGCAEEGRDVPAHAEATTPNRLEDIFVLCLAVVGILLLAICEVVFLRDGFGNRMNTVFKLYYQAWVLLAVSAGYTIYYLGLRRRVGEWRWPAVAGYRVWRVFVVVLVAGGLVYTVFAPLSKAGFFAGEPTLDGLAWLRKADPQEYAAISWLANVGGTPTILEASGGEYSRYNQASAFTGLPSVLGWAGHEYQWRGNTPEPAVRRADVDAIYRTTDVKLAERLLDKYDVTFVYVGDVERRAFADAPAGALTKFSRFMDIAFRNEQVIIYRTR